jgi:hypothetical protein
MPALSLLAGPIPAIGLMSGTSQASVDAALIETDGEIVAQFGPTANRAYTQEERAVLRPPKSWIAAACVTWRCVGWRIAWRRRTSKLPIGPAGRRTRSGTGLRLSRGHCAGRQFRSPARPACRIRLPAAFSRCP